MGNIAFFRLEITKKSALGKDLEKYNIQVDENNSRKAIRVDNIPFSLQLNDQELHLVERAYAATADYFIQRDLNGAVNSLLENSERIASSMDVPWYPVVYTPPASHSFSRVA